MNSKIKIPLLALDALNFLHYQHAKYFNYLIGGIMPKARKIKAHQKLKTHSAKNNLNASETIVSTTTQPSPTELCGPYTKNTRGKYIYVTLEEALKRFREASESFGEPSKEHSDANFFFNKNDTKTKKFIDSIQKEIAKYISNDSIADVRLRAREDKSFAAWVSLKDNTKELRIDKSFLSGLYEASNQRVTSAVLVSKEDLRLLRLSQDNNGVRLYEITNGSSTIKFD